MKIILNYLDEIERALQQVRDTQLSKISQGAHMLAQATLHQHNLFVFGCNHAGLLALELYYRTGGMVNMNPLRAPGLNLEATPATLTSQIERLEDYGRLIIDSSPVAKDDVVIIHSVSGRNPVTVDAAMRLREIGAKVIALTNMATTSTVKSRHHSGLNLYQVADLVLDNCGCLGDAALVLPGAAVRVGPTSTVIGAAVLNAMICEAVELIVAEGKVAPVFVSANLDEGDAFNENVLNSYKEHIFYM